MSDGGKLHWLERYETAWLISLLTGDAGRGFRSAPAISLAQRMVPVREMRIARGVRERRRLDQLIEYLAAC
jgi:hypothetical protein